MGNIVYTAYTVGYLMEDAQILLTVILYAFLINKVQVQFTQMAQVYFAASFLST